MRCATEIPFDAGTICRVLPSAELGGHRIIFVFFEAVVRRPERCMLGRYRALWGKADCSSDAKEVLSSYSVESVLSWELQKSFRPRVSMGILTAALPSASIRGSVLSRCSAMSGGVGLLLFPAL